MVEEIIGSKMRAEVGYGDTADGTPSSIRKGERIKRSSVSKSIIAAHGGVSANPGDWQTRPISLAQAVPTHPGLKGNMPASLPGKTQAKRPSSIPVKPGNFVR
jgi:hypothetical protein